VPELSTAPTTSRLPNPVAWLRGVWGDTRLLGRAFGLLLRAKPRLGLALVLPVQELVTTLVQQSGVATVERTVIAAGPRVVAPGPGAGLPTPTSGEITLDGEPLRRYDLAGLRARTTVVYQDAARFAFMLADNLALADPNGGSP